MTPSRVQEAIKVLKASVGDEPIAKKVKAKEGVRASKTKKAAKAKN